MAFGGDYISHNSISTDETWVNNPDEIKQLEREIAAYIAKDIKNRSGKGPVDTQVFIKEEFVLVKVTGYFSVNEIQLSQEDFGFFDAKMTRYKWIHMNRNEILKGMSSFLGKEVYELFYDANPRIDMGIMVFLYK